MDRKATDGIVTVIGIDICKNTFHLVGLDKHGAIALRQKLSRGQVAGRLRAAKFARRDRHGSLAFTPGATGAGQVILAAEVRGNADP
jgi:hypothetical protein